MSELIQFNTGKTDIVLVKRPEWYVSHAIYMGYIIFKVHNEGNFISTKAIENPVLCRKALEKHNPAKDYKDIAIKLPNGDWADIGNAFELSEEQWRSVLPNFGGKIFDYDPKDYPSYQDYAFIDHPFDSKFFQTAKESGLSLLNHLKVYQVNPFAGIFRPRLVDSSELKDLGSVLVDAIYHDLRDEWKKAEERTGKWELLTAVKA